MVLTGLSHLSKQTDVTAALKEEAAKAQLTQPSFLCEPFIFHVR